LLKGYRQLREKQNQRDEETERRGQQWMWNVNECELNREQEINHQLGVQQLIL
jgi:hypothetical protein